MEKGSARTTGLRRQLGLLDGVAVFVGIIVGSGIFVAPAVVSGVTPSIGAAVGLWLVGGAIAACGALCYAECGARVPRTGGAFVFYLEAYGEPLAFVAGWAAVLVTYPASTAAISLVLADYLSQVVPAAGAWKPGAAAAAVLVAGTLNAVGVRVGAWAQRLLSATKVAALALLCLAALAGAPDPIAAPAAEASGHGGLTLAALLAAAVLVAWTYDGWSDVSILAGELRSPARDLSRTVLVGIATVVTLYALVQFSVEKLLGPRAAASDSVVADAVAAAMGEDAGRLVAVLVVTCTFGAINAIVLTGSRIGYAMARAGVFPAAVGAVHARFGSPARSVGGLTAAALVYVFVTDFRGILSLFSFAVWLFYALTAVALLLLRRRRVGEPLEWRAPGAWLPPAVVVLAACGMSGSLLVEDTRHALAGLALLLGGLLVHQTWCALRRG